jgi:hypothetical protein
MARNALRDGLVTEDSITCALLECKGDLFLSSSYLGVTARELDGYIRASEELQAFVAAIKKVKSNADYDSMSAEQFSNELDRLTSQYKVEALDIIHELATMQAKSAADREVKLKAAIQLHGVAPERKADSTQLATLNELNDLYYQSAQRIKSVRIQTAQIEFHGQDTEQSGTLVLNQQGSVV